MPTSTTLQGIPLAGLRLGAPLGSGAGGVVWAATTAEGDKVTVRVLPDVETARRIARSARLERLRALDHPGLAGPVAMGEEVDERLLVTRLVDGPTLATVRAGRMGLPALEALALAAELSDALAALHSQGVCHGDIAPGNVVISETDDGVGHAVLVDLVADLGWEVGTPGFVAPEVRDGQVAHPPSDVWALATLCVWVARPGERDEVARALDGALLSEPSARPEAASLARSLRRRQLSPLRVPPRSVLAGAALRERAQRSETVLRPARRRRARHRRRATTPRSLALGLAGALLVVVVLGWTLDRGHAERTTGTASAALAPTAAQVLALVTARDQALVDLDAAALGEVTAPGSSAAAQDAALLQDLLTSGSELDGLRTEVSGTQMLASSERQATVRTMLRQRAYERTTEGITVEVAAQEPRCVVLELTLAEGTWRVASVSPCEV